MMMTREDWEQFFGALFACANTGKEEEETEAELEALIAPVRAKMEADGFDNLFTYIKASTGAKVLNCEVEEVRECARELINLMAERGWSELSINRRDGDVQVLIEGELIARVVATFDDGIQELVAAAR